MSAFLKVFGIWGLIDGLWLAISPASWSRFWGGWIARLGEGGTAPRALALVEILASLVLLRRRPSGRQPG
ncbi:hypothetical protein [Nitrolancea hollandica]|uniref:hypothetical protein n=1 Tax=Nitrolancea hollandica TaxID=1206749 RepID=UPI0002FEF532|nr:hypothetical protein [Nitrolancea hollandica]